MDPFHPACLYAHYGMEREDFCLKTLALIIETPIFPTQLVVTTLVVFRSDDFGRFP